MLTAIYGSYRWDALLNMYLSWEAAFWSFVDFYPNFFLNNVFPTVYLV